jgi:hypothetical protein
VRGLANVSLQAESLKESYLQAFLSRGDRSLARFIVKAAETGSWRKAARELALDVELEVTRTIPLDEQLPWDFVSGVSVDLLKQEYRRAFAKSESANL